MDSNAENILEWAEIQNIFEEMNVYMDPDLIDGVTLGEVVEQNSLLESTSDFNVFGEYYGIPQSEPIFVELSDEEFKSILPEERIQEMEFSAEPEQESQPVVSLQKMPVPKLKNVYWPLRRRNIQKCRNVEKIKCGKISYKIEQSQKELAEMEEKLLKAEARSQFLEDALNQIGELCKTAILSKPHEDDDKDDK